MLKAVLKEKFKAIRFKSQQSPILKKDLSPLPHTSYKSKLLNEINEEQSDSSHSSSDSDNAIVRGITNMKGRTVVVE